MSDELINQNTELTNRPSYLPVAEQSNIKQQLKAFSEVSKPPFMKIIQDQTGEPFKPPFESGDIIVTPQMEKLGDMENYLNITPINYFTTWACINPWGSNLPFYRKIIFDKRDDQELYDNCINFVDEPCPEFPNNPKMMLDYNEIINFLVLVEGFPLAIHMSFRSGSYKLGQNLIGLISTQMIRHKVDMYMLKFRCKSKRTVDKGNKWFTYLIQNSPETFVSESLYPQAKASWEMYTELVKEKALDLSGEDYQTQEQPLDVANSEM